MQTYVLDTGVLLQGMEPPRGRCLTTPEVEAEVRPGGRDARRLAYWLAAGLQVHGAAAGALRDVDAAAAAAGNLGRLSPADRSVLALALQEAATLLSDDHTVLDVARRLGVKAQPVRGRGISETLDFRPRCLGCGRWFDLPGPTECPVCGSQVRAKPKR